MMGEPASIEVERASYTPARATQAVRSSHLQWQPAMPATPYGCKSLILFGAG